MMNITLLSLLEVAVIRRESKVMKEKLKVFLLIIMCFTYLILSYKYAFNKWKNGIAYDEITKEDLLIWQNGVGALIKRE